MSLFTAQLHPNRALGFLILGASLHDVLTRIKAEPQKFLEIELSYSHDNPVQEPVIVGLPANGIRLRFDGPEQRLRLIEVIDFTKNHITFKDRDVVRPVNSQGGQGGPSSSPVPGESTSGPTFRHIYHRLLGPTYAGEYIPPSDDFESPGVGVYVLSYPGVAFNFPLPSTAYAADKDVVSLLSTPASQIASSMAVFSGDSWAAAREVLWTEVLPSVKASPALPKGKDMYPDEISLIRIHGGGRLQLSRKWTNSFVWLLLGETTPQELVAELGPPNAIYRKSDQRMVIHKLRSTSHSRSRPSLPENGRPDELTDTDQSSLQTGSDDSDEGEAIEDAADGNISGECFYNYFHLGFDVLVSTPTPPSRAPPHRTDTATTSTPPANQGIRIETPDRQVATKLVLHGNVPGSYEFNRHRRCRWEISYLDGGPAMSETRFSDIEERLNETWRSAQGEGEGQRQRGMVLNRGWGDSPGSSCEFLGGWEESGGERPGTARRGDGQDDTTTLFGFPGLVFEVLRNGFVNTVTVF